MAWQYSDYLAESNTPATIARLKLHIAEVANALASPISQNIDGNSYALANLTAYLANLKTELQELQATAHGVQVMRCAGGYR